MARPCGYRTEWRLAAAARPETGCCDRGAPAGSDRPYRQRPANGNRLAGIVTHRIFLGSTAEYQISVDGLGDFLVTADRRSVQESDLVEPGETGRTDFRSRQSACFSGLRNGRTRQDKKGNTVMTKWYRENAPITAENLTDEWMRLKRGSVTRRHFLGVTGLGLAPPFLPASPACSIP
jgi:hypothetical protein